MPYISKEKRDEINIFMDDLIDELEERGFMIGDLAYILYRICLAYINAYDYEPHFSIYNSVIGVLESVKLEFYRKKVAPYEDTKESENGAIYSTREREKMFNEKTDRLIEAVEEAEGNEDKGLDYYMKLPYKTVIEYDTKEKCFIAWIPEIGKGNACGYGSTKEKALEHLEISKANWFDRCLSLGIVIPEPNE